MIKIERILVNNLQLFNLYIHLIYVAFILCELVEHAYLLLSIVTNLYINLAGFVLCD
jgi:hypothetical protein